MLISAGKANPTPSHTTHRASIEVTLHGRLAFRPVGPHVVEFRSEQDADRKFRQVDIEGKYLVCRHAIDPVIPIHHDGRVSALGVEVDCRAILIPEVAAIAKDEVLVVVLSHAVTTFHLRSAEDQFHARLVSCPPNTAEFHRRVDTPQSGF